MSDQTRHLVSIVDYGMGNLFSVKRACAHIGLNARVTSDKKEILSSGAVILPGVGAYGDAMSNLRRLDLVGALKDFIESGRPFMGVCLGMQLLMAEGEEMGLHEGLGVFGGRVIRFSNPDKKDIKIPQIGWNRITKPSGGKNWEGSMLKGVADGEFMYFIHSYYVLPEDPEIILSVTDYEGIRYCSSLSRKNVFACQFHPEQSGGEGLKIYRNFASA